MIRPKTLNRKLLKEFRSDYDRLTGNGDIYDFRIMCVLAWGWGKNFAVDYTMKQFNKIAEEIYENTNFKEYEKQKYYIKQYFTLVCLEKLKEKILCGEIMPNKRYIDFLNESKNVKINWFDKIKLRLTSKIFFEYLIDKYYYFRPEAELKHEYGKSLYKRYNFLEKIWFSNKYRAFAVMQDYHYNAKRIAKFHFSAVIMIKKPRTAYSTALIRFKIMLILFLVMFIVYGIMNLIYF